VVAHELAHYALGHLEVGRLRPHRLAQVDARREADTDLLAIRATRLAAQRSGTIDEFIVGLGALLSIVALYGGERVLFVLAGTAHPPALERGALVLAELPARSRAVAPVDLWVRPGVNEWQASGIFRSCGWKADLVHTNS
jgi:hypothetical protein